METLLDARHLTRRFGAETAVDDVSLTLGRGEVLGFLGPNGAGKSTCLALLTGNLRPDAGIVQVLGRDLWAAPRAAKAHIGFLPEHPPLYPDLRVDEFLAYAGRLHRLRGPALAAAVARAKERCSLGEVGRRLIGTLSKGYRQRVGIAQAILHEPPLVLLDEPTVGLDPMQIRDIRALVRELGRDRGVLLSSHLLAEAQALCSRVLILHRGRIAYASGTRDDATLYLRLARPPAPEAWHALSAVQAAEPLGAGEFRVRPTPGTATAAVAEQVVAAGWGLEQLHPSGGDLERAFVRAVSGEAAP